MRDESLLRGEEGKTTESGPGGNRFQLKDSDRWALERLGERVYSHRKRLGLSQMELAERAEITSGYVSEVERGRKSVSYVVVIRLAEGLRISLEHLLGGAGKTENHRPEQNAAKDTYMGNECMMFYRSIISHAVDRLGERELKVVSYFVTALSDLYGNGEAG